MKTSTSSPDISSIKKQKINKPLRLLLSFLFWMAVWFGAAEWVGMELLVPTPLAVLSTLYELVQTSSFWISAGLSLLRIFCGTLAGIVLGILLAVLICRSELADMLLSPAIRILRTIPVSSFILLVLLWVRTGFVPGVISALIVLPVIWESVTAGIHAADPQLLEFGRAYELSAWKTLRYIRLPALKPHLSSAICNAIGLAWKSGVAAEVLCLPKKAIGTQVYFSKLYLETPSLFAWTIVVIILSLLLETIIKKLLMRDAATL